MSMGQGGGPRNEYGTGWCSSYLFRKYHLLGDWKAIHYDLI